MISSWTISGANQQPIYGQTHMPVGKPTAQAIIAHGFKGYKDYGFIPALAAHLATAGLVAHRFNFSHCGMTERVDTFEHPELFARDTWNKQVTDIQTVATAAEAGTLLPGCPPGLPQLWIGHSRGGGSVLLAAGRSFECHLTPSPAGLVTLAAVDRCCSLSDDDRQLMLEQGYLDAPSARTGQRLRMNATWLIEQEQDPEHHNILAAARLIRCPLLVVHGQDDDTVPVTSAKAIVDAVQDQATLVVLPGVNHTFNAPNPMPMNGPLPAGTAAMIEHVQRFARTFLSR